MLDVKPAGEPGLKEPSGGGVADIARGEEWFEDMGDKAGEESWGEECSAGGLTAGRGDGRWRCMLCVLEPESSTSCSKDCKNVGAPGSIVSCRLATGLARRDDWRDLELVALDVPLSETERTGTLGRLRLITRAGSCSGAAAGDDLPDCLFLLRDELGSFDEAQACSKACHAMSSSAFST